MKRLPVCFFCFLFFTNTFSQNTSSSGRPKIGLTLSGGGAKGLAHIGILKAIDSAGLKIDYVTGTSMGAIIGSLYAVGYSGDSIEKIASTIDWDVVLSNQSSLRNIIMEEKSEYGKYDLELPWVNHWFRLSTGVLEAQELWLKFSELLFPVYNIKDFSKFQIPFKCIATDISTGEGIVLDSGEIISAVRSSMAIPSLFTAVPYAGRKLVDGGIVRNFPVRDVKEMGADIVIGSNVANGLLSADKVTNALQVLLQVAFFREAEDTKTEVPLCTIYVPARLDKYNMGSFSYSDEIIEAGLEEGRKLYPRLKQLADSLNAIYGPQEIVKDKLPAVRSVKISSVEVKGLKHTTPDFFTHTMNILTNHVYTPENLSRMVRKGVGTRYYNRIAYSLQPQADSTCKIIFEVSENPLTFAKIGLHYSQFSKIAAILNLTTRDFFTPNSRSLATLNIGENFRVRGEHLQFFSRGRKFSFKLGTQFDIFNITSYTNLKEAGLFTQNYLRAFGEWDYSTNRNLTVGLGTRFEWLKNNPSITSSVAFKGENNFFTNYFVIRHNTLDRPVFPKRGMRIEAEAGWVSTQHPDVLIHTNSRDIDTAISNTPYSRLTFNMEAYAPLGGRSTFLLNLQSGMNFQGEKNIMNEFSIGGLVSTFHNQITFAGLREGSFYSPSLAAAMVGLRYQLYNSVYVTAKANVLVNNFISKPYFFTNPDFLSGYSLTFSYNFALGPLELSLMYCDQWKTVLGYVNIGVPF
ncbi:MAG: patatin-like phospholipase family protein [Bacteroidetes bacterium]|nr:patatin-like phospholipase family protein [Bacteroidota bacterium]